MRSQYRLGWNFEENRGFFERAYRREFLPLWDARWQRLSLDARHSFLHLVKLPERDPLSSEPLEIHSSQRLSGAHPGRARRRWLRRGSGREAPCNP